MLNNSSFLYPKCRYYGDVKPENLVFDANLQEFSHRVSYISALATNGKIPLAQAISEIELLWEKLEKSKKELGVGEHPFAA